MNESLTFNYLLKLAGLEPNTVKLYRHGEVHKKDRRSPYMLWITSKEEQHNNFDFYQSIQSVDHKLDRRYIASFVVTPFKETTFVGIYENFGSLGHPPEGTICPVSQEPLGEKHLQYDLRLTEYMSEYAGRLVINWGAGYIRWHQNADNDSPKIVEQIKKEAVQIDFPGFDRFVCLTRDVDKLPNAWKEVLRNSQGIYLLTCLDTGKRYVGSAYGEDRLLGRLQGYCKTGHNGNKRMTAHQTSGYQVSILEVASSSDDVNKVIERENNWKEKLMTQHEIFGLNDN